MLCLVLTASMDEIHILGLILSDAEDIIVSSYFTELDKFNSGEQFLCSETKFYAIN